MDTSSVGDDVEEGLDGSCDFSFSQYPPVQLPLDPTRHIKQPVKGCVIYFVYIRKHRKHYNFIGNKLIKSSSTVKPKQDEEKSHIPSAADLFSNPVC